MDFYRIDFPNIILNYLLGYLAPIDLFRIKSCLHKVGKVKFDYYYMSVILLNYVPTDHSFLPIKIYTRMHNCRYTVLWIYSSYYCIYAYVLLI